MTLAACAALVQRGDPDRFLAVMAAPPPLRARLFPVYAFNLEVARAPWVTAEPLIAQMRLQWWRDVVAAAASGAALAHEVAGPLHGVIRDAGLPVAVLDRLITARGWDITPDPQPDLEGYLDATGGGLMWLAAKASGAPDTAEAAARDAGWAAGLAGYLQAVPALVARGRVPLPDTSAPAIAGLAREGLARLARAKAAPVPRAAIPALRAGWQARMVLTRAEREPGLVLSGGLVLPEFNRRGALLWASLTGGW